MIVEGCKPLEGCRQKDYVIIWIAVWVPDHGGARRHDVAVIRTEKLRRRIHAGEAVEMRASGQRGLWR